MNRWAKFSTAVVAATVVAASSASAQSANINVTANVFQAITVAAGTNLDFGNVFPGVNKTITVTDAGAGRWDATGQATQPVNMTFTLPTNLVNGANNLAINTWTGCRDGDNTVAGCTPFTPSGSATAAAFGGGGVLTVWIGATVAPIAAQVAGAYTATATLTLAYF
jgi:hypothetical protein